ncbi:MAG TPA: SLBB domain-containing protein [Terracidiphilus sp.]
MNQRLSLLLLFFSTLCLGQSVLTTPGSQTPSAPASATAPRDTTGTSNVPPTEIYDLREGQSTDTRLPQPPRRPRPILTPTDFELFAEDVAGHPLKVYGRQLFDEPPSTFAPLDRVPVPANYVVGPGDELLIRVWGKIDLDGHVTVDRNGQISLPRVGTLTVAGLRYEQLDSFLRNAVGNLYKDFQLNVTMGRLRSIQVFVLGSARQPGAYTVSSLSTLVNALFASGGPSATGTMRRIQLRRGDQRLTEFDVYDLLRRGDKSHDVQLLPGDVIYIPPIGPQVAIVDNVNDPGIYELKGDTTVADALANAGGLTSLARVDRAILERIENHARRRVDEFALDGSGLQRMLMDGDLLRIGVISPRFENSVTLRGNVARPGRFLWHEGMRVSDVIPSRDVLITRRHWNQQNSLAGPTPQNQLSPSDFAPNRTQGDQQRYPAEDQRYSQEQRYSDDPRYSEDPRYAADGQQGYPPDNQQTYPPDASNPNRLSARQADQLASLAAAAGSNPSAVPLHHEHWDQQTPQSATPRTDVISDLALTDAEINWDYAVIERLDPLDLTTRLVSFNLARAIDDPASADNQLLKAGDVVTVFSRRDLPLPLDKHSSFIRVGGEVAIPGVYRVEPGETLRNVVERAGGLTAHSYLYASQLTRVSTRQAEEAELRLSINQMQRDVMSKYAAAPSVGTSAVEQQAQLGAQQAVLSQLSAVHPTGRIVLDMKPGAASVADIPAFPLEDGDSYYIPPRLGTVQVAGAVYNENAFRYQPKKQVAAYLADAGGPNRQADKKHAFVIRADGTVVARQSHNGLWRNEFEDLTLLPGDSIVIPTKLKSPNNFAQQLPYYTQILSSAALTGATISTIH